MWKRFLLLFFVFGLSASCFGASVNWNASIVDAEHGAPDGYRVYYGYAADQLDTVHDNGQATAFDVPDAWPTNTYFFGVRAYNANGESDWATTESGQTWISYTKSAPPIDPPSAATDVRVGWEQIEEIPVAIDLTLSYATTAPGWRTNITISAPSGVASGDFLLAAVATHGSVAVSTPSGWTAIGTYIGITSRVRLYLFYQRYESGSSWAFSHSYTFSAGVIKRITGVVTTGDPEDCTRDTSTENYTEGPITLGAITTATDGAAVIAVAALAYENSNFNTTVTLTSRVQNGFLSMWGDLQATAGSTGSETFDWPGAGGEDYDYCVGYLIALRPDTGGGGASAVPAVMRSYRARRN